MFSGVYTALITPFDKNFRVDLSALEKLLVLQEKSQVQGVVVLGTTAEECTLDGGECEKIIQTARRVLKEKKLIVGVSGNCTKSVIEKIQSYEKFDIDGYLVGTPYYNKPTQNGLYMHFQQIAKCTKKPIILYNIPSRCGVKIGFDVLEKLSKFDNIVAIKEASGDIDYFTKLISQFADRYNILCGNDNMLLPMLACGATGCVSVISNLMPKLPVDILNFYASDIDMARKLHNRYLDVCNAMFIETNPAPIKYALHKKNLCENILRSPLVSIDKCNQKAIDRLLKLKNY